MRGSISKNYSAQDVKSVFTSFSREFWFAPSDVFLRVTEALIWSKQDFASPVLDIGCGDGRISKFLFAGRREIDVGLDNDPKEVENAKSSGVYRKLIVADAAKMPFKEGTFRTVISNSTFEHVENDIRAIGEVSRVLMNNGRFLFTVPTKRLSNTILDLIKGREKFKQFNIRVNHFHYRKLTDWQKILEQNKFKLKHREYYFPKEAVKIWYKLFKVTTFKPYRRELWSYLKDSPYGKLAPRGIIAFLISNYLSKFYEKLFTEKGNWVLITAQKRI